jgi:hypothetical protein
MDLLRSNPPEKISISINRPNHAKAQRNQNDSTMYPPTRATFSPSIPGLAQMPSPPSPLRALVHRLNSTPTRRHKVATPMAIKTEPQTETKTKSTFNFSSSSNQASSLSTQRSLPTRNTINTTPNSSISSNSSNNSNSNQPALSQALVNLLQSQLATPTSSNNDENQTPILDFENSRIEIHFHVHPILRPAFLTPVSLSQKLKRKRGSDSGERGDGITERQEETGRNRIGNEHDLDLDIDVTGERRSKKKVKLSHDFDPLSGCSAEGRGVRVGSGAADAGRVKTRSRTTGTRRFSMSNRR